MKTHEIYLEIDPNINPELTLTKITNTLSIQHRIQKIVNNEILKNTIKKHNVTLSKEHLNTLHNGYKLYFDESISRASVDNQINALSSLPGVSSVRYTGLLVSCAENYDFPTLSS